MRCALLRFALYFGAGRERWLLYLDVPEYAKGSRVVMRGNEMHALRTLTFWHYVHCIQIMYVHPRQS